MLKESGTKRLVESLIKKVTSSQRNPGWCGWPLVRCTIALLMKLPKASVASRWVSGLSKTVQSQNMKVKLGPYCSEGQYASKVLKPPLE
jgi:hypothetical protein